MTGTGSALHALATALPFAAPFYKLRIGPYDYDVKWIGGEAGYPGFTNLVNHELGAVISAKPAITAERLYRQVQNALTDAYDINLVLICTEDELKKAGDDIEAEIETVEDQYCKAQMTFWRSNPEARKWMMECWE